VVAAAIVAVAVVAAAVAAGAAEIAGRVPGWRIAEWSCERGRGKIESDAGMLEFDRKVAEVDDFAIGESVSIRLVDGEVINVTPTTRPRVSLMSGIPVALGWTWKRSLMRLSRALAEDDTDLAVVDLVDGHLRLRVESRDWSRELATATLGGVSGIQLPTSYEYFRSVSAAMLTDVIAVNPPWLASLCVDPQDADPADVLVCFESAEYGDTRAGFVIARSLDV
jgi:hypothetical protein